MGFYSDKIRKYWFPFVILMIVVLAVGWVLAGVIYPNNVQGNDQQPPTALPPTATQEPTSTPSETPTLVPTDTPTVSAATATPSYNCTYSKYYWTTNEDKWVIENLVLGNLWAEQFGDNARARVHYLKVLELDPRHPQATAIRYWLVAHPP